MPFPRISQCALAACLLGGAAHLTAQVVSLAAPDAEATEAGVYPGLFRLTRTGGTGSALTVSLAYGGTGRPGEDYETLPATVVIPAGQSSVDLVLEPINDPVVEAAPDTVIATLQPSAGYTVGEPASATLTIADNETFTTTAPLLYRATVDSPTAITVHWTDNFETETKYRVQRSPAGQSAWTSVDAPADSGQWKFTGLTPGQDYDFRVSAYQGSTASPSSSILRVFALAPATPAPAPATFAEWRSTHQLDGGHRPFAGQAFADPDADGRPNFLEYLLDSDPWIADAAGPALGFAPGGGRSLHWTENPAALDGTLTLEESTDLTAWQTSPLPATATPDGRAVTDLRASAARFYRLKATATVPVTPSPLITCWGDSLTGNPGTYVSKLATLLPGRTLQNGGIGGDTSLQIVDRLRGLTLTSPYPAFAADTPAGTTVRLVASRTTHARIMNPGNRSSWATYAATLATVERVEFFNFDRRIGEATAPLTASVTSDRAAHSSRLLAPGHPFADGDVVHFPAGPLPAPLVAGKTYYVRDADAGGFALVESDVFYTVTASSAAPSARFVSAGHPFADGDTAWFRRGEAPPGLLSDRIYHVRDADSGGFALAAAPGGPALTMIYSTTGGAILGRPGAALTLAADFAAPTPVQGPFVCTWNHPGGPTALTLRTHTDRDTATTLLWMGRNNSGRPHEIYADVHAAVRQLKALNARFLLVSVTNGGGESAGSPYYYHAVNLNHLLRREFPGEFVDVRTALIRAASADANDQADRAADIPPRSLRTDNVHFNDAGQQRIAELLAAELTRRGW